VCEISSVYLSLSSSNHNNEIIKFPIANAGRLLNKKYKNKFSSTKTIPQPRQNKDNKDLNK